MLLKPFFPLLAATLLCVNGAHAADAQRPLWSRDGEISPAAVRWLLTMRSAEVYGLRAMDYGAEALTARATELMQDRRPDPRRWDEFDLAVSAATVRFLKHLHFGRVDPRAAGFDLRHPRPNLDTAALVTRLAQTNTADDVQAVVAEVEPQFHHYRLLKQALARYRKLASDPTLTNLPPLPGRRSVQLEQSYAGAPALRKLLITVGDFPASTAAAAPADNTLEATLVEAIRRFQERHGLDADGVLGRKTFAALTTPLDRRVRQIELTLERWRWLPAFDAPPIVVNIPRFRLYAFQSAHDGIDGIIQMPVIVGQTYPHTRTPVFVSDMKYVVFRPYWDVPAGILHRELLPQIRANPGVLQRQSLEIVRGQTDAAIPAPPTPANIAALAAGKLRLRQRPGPDNSLGLIKFILPNAYNVYLHATPANELFKQTRRTFSHGCIRVSDPVRLAAHVLRDTPGDWTPAKIEAAMNGATTQRVYLSRPIRVMVLYGTAVATDGGQVLFFEDIYGHDQKLERLLGL